MTETMDFITDSCSLKSDSCCDSFNVEVNLEPEKGGFRAVIDTSVPFESVKEAAIWFGGFGHWKPSFQQQIYQAQVEILKEQAAKLQNDLNAKESETLGILKELETAKLMVEELKSKVLQNHTFETSKRLALTSVLEEEKENLDTSSSPAFILMQLKQAKLNLDRTTTDLSDTRASIKSYNKKIEEEKISIEKTQMRLNSNSSNILLMEEELNQTRKKLEQAKDIAYISKKLQILSYEADEFKKIGEAAKSKIAKMVSEIELTKTQIKTAEIRLIAAENIKEAAIATEDVTIAGIKALSNRDSEQITLSFEEYSSLKTKARKAEELSKNKVIEALFQVDVANVSKNEVLKEVEKAKQEVIASKIELEEALARQEAATTEKLSVEEALRKWRSNQCHKRQSMHNSRRFKNAAYPIHNPKSSLQFNVNRLNLTDQSVSIGQVLSNKVRIQPEGLETGMEKETSGVKHVSPIEMVDEQNGDDETENDQKEEVNAKKMKLGLGKLLFLLRQKSKKNKNGFIYRSCISPLR